jgi:pantetheine-phosphate adenylyltransferase
MGKKIAVYPGTFDPVTFGHIDVLRRAARIFDKVIISVSESMAKNTLLTAQERVDLIRKSAKNIRNIEVDKFSGLLVKYAKKKKADAIIRGLRAISDFEYELQMALTNRKIWADVETVFFMPNEKFSFISSTLVKEIAANGGNLQLCSGLFPPLISKYRSYK